MRALAQGATGEFFVTLAVFLFRPGRVRVALGHPHAEQPAALGQFFLAITIPQKPVIADAMKAVWHHMHQKAADEFIGGQGHRFDLVAIPVILPSELDLIRFDVEQAVV